MDKHTLDEKINSQSLQAKEEEKSLQYNTTTIL